MCQPVAARCCVRLLLTRPISGKESNTQVYSNPIHSIGIRLALKLRDKVARRYQITIPEEVCDDAGMNIGDTLDVRSQDRKVVIEK